MILKANIANIFAMFKQNSIPEEISEWMEINPREQKMTTNIAVKIKESLKDNPYFYELNRGVVI